MIAVDDRALTAFAVLACLLLIGLLLHEPAIAPTRVAPTCPAARYCPGPEWHVLFTAPGFAGGAVAAAENVGAGHPAAPE